MNINLRTFKIWTPLALAVTFALGLWIGKTFFSTSRHDSRIDKLETILGYIEQNYVDEINTDSLLEAVLPDLMDKLDPHSTYISASDLTAVNEDLDGSFSGIGIQFNLLNDTIVVVEVIGGGPSERVGLMPGDRIVTIDDSTAVGKGMTNERVTSRLRGPKGTTVSLEVRRSSSPELLHFDIKRGDIPVNSVVANYMIDKTTGYINVDKFGRTTAAEFLTALTTLKAQGADDYIVDLRGNGGGYMEMAMLMANEFLPGGNRIVSTRGRHFDDDGVFTSDGTGSFADSRVVVLIDEYSASASEILAGALQDNDRGVIVGRRSFGKGLVQSQLPLPDSSAIRLTVARYYTPSGRSIQKTYNRGNGENYRNDLLERYNHGEAFSADSIRLDTTVTYLTSGGRKVYGGGGIMPDIFVPNDTTGLTTYFLRVSNAGLLQRYAFRYLEQHRSQLEKATTAEELMQMLPPDTRILQDFADFAEANGIERPFWKTINQSRNAIVRNIKAAIARDALGMNASYQIFNAGDPTVQRAVELLRNGYEKVLKH